ncbi:hypothetical protein ILUMI_17000 [Ignelater luminosus]|uniref:Uncharacterized protein n=1 Tax=Ignelater luminosus TaxID=2038154 RepID=A0A8K0CR88_IGNLU|nr:hypothetical protein ILUMI_17000 [Ignelater luminosus]
MCSKSSKTKKYLLPKPKRKRNDNCGPDMDYGEVQKANYSHKADMTENEFKTKSEEPLISLIKTETKVSQIERATVSQRAIPLWFE